MMGASLSLISTNQKRNRKYRGRFLIVDDETSANLILKSILEGEDLRVEAVTNEKDMFACLKRYSFDAVFLDYKLGSVNGLNLVPRILREYPYCRIIMITAHGSIDLAVNAGKKGVSGFITKPFDEEKVLVEISKALKEKTKPNLEPSTLIDSEIIGNSPEILRIHEQINKMKDVDSTVLILGESGTGKELVARALHQSSKRKEGQFEAINCAAIPDSLLEAELFGCKKGAFTDAKTDRKGLFEICNNGTLFLDEIGEMPIHLQSKLLRALQEKEVTPLGGSRSVKITTRVVAATNQNLDKLVRDGKFRKDLFYRLSVLQILLPPLRERKDDIRLLANHFIERLSKQFSKKIEALENSLMLRLESYEWPGNVRELYNSLERAIVLSTDGMILMQDLFAHLESHEDLEDFSSGEFKPLQIAKEEFERQYLEKLLESTKGNVTTASKIAGRMRTDMYRLFSKHDIDPNSYKEGG